MKYLLIPVFTFTAVMVIHKKLKKQKKTEVYHGKF